MESIMKVNVAVSIPRSKFKLTMTSRHLADKLSKLGYVVSIDTTSGYICTNTLCVHTPVTSLQQLLELFKGFPELTCSFWTSPEEIQVTIEDESFYE